MPSWVTKSTDTPPAAPPVRTTVRVTLVPPSGTEYFAEANLIWPPRSTSVMVTGAVDGAASVAPLPGALSSTENVRGLGATTKSRRIGMLTSFDVCPLPKVSGVATPV